MRIYLEIEHLAPQKLPINYQYHISSWIYKCIHSSDSDFAHWLHERGYEINGKRYKHFCFSKLNPKVYRIDSKDKAFILEEGPSSLILSFNIDKAMREMISALFEKNFIELRSGQSFEFLGMIRQVKLLAQPEFREQMNYRTITPICISVTEEDSKYAKYLSPLDDLYPIALAKNLVDKANAFLGEEAYTMDQVQFKLIGQKVKNKLFKIKGTFVKGYEFEFELLAPPALQEIAYNAGFGNLNAALGMGMCDVVMNRNKK